LTIGSIDCAADDGQSGNIPPIFVIDSGGFKQSQSTHWQLITRRYGGKESPPDTLSASYHPFIWLNFK
jgi:hypothetical protein